VQDTSGESREELGEEKYQEKIKCLLKPYRLTSICVSTARVVGFISLVSDMIFNGRAIVLMDMKNHQHLHI
jgi:hypothetical protein